jgi:hypothetical protein
MRRILSTLAAVILLTSCSGSGAGEPPSPPDSGIRGTVTAGPQCPVVQEGSPCPDVPWEGKIRITGDSVDLEIATFSGGRFAIAIEPGTYTVQPVVTGPGSASSVSVEVPGQGYVEVALTIDTGIR